ncbi:alanine aminotransferase 2-like [Dermacentor variabilis]|uniref:alanine aminotransferase 2-like n=1 Tax=Dermacentor variabilis TaxID=34621 RepID=UPI003F5C9C8A
MNEIHDHAYVYKGYEAFWRMFELSNNLEALLQNGEEHGFPYLIRCDLCDPQAQGQKPITFLRQVLSVCAHAGVAENMPKDVVERAREILDKCPGRSVGSMDIQGHPTIRTHIADFISKKASVQAAAENIWITHGVMHGVSTVLQVLKRRLNGEKAGALTCIPQYMGFHDVFKKEGYYLACYCLDEDHDWAHDTTAMQKALDALRMKCKPRCLVLVNPGNPSSTVLSTQQIEDIVEFAYKNQLVILADEVFQDNCYCKDRPFRSVRAVMNEMDPPYARTPLVTFHSLAKGFIAEAGFWVGYLEAINLDSTDRENLESAMTLSKVPLLTQVALDCMVKPPQLAEPSYDLYNKEKTSIIESLAERARLAEERINAIEGMHCNPIQGAMSAYVRVQIPAKAIEEAQRQDKGPDEFYAEELLKRKGVCVIPGSGFGRLPGRFHIRITILPSREQLLELLDRLESFHKELLMKYH